MQNYLGMEEYVQYIYIYDTCMNILEGYMHIKYTCPWVHAVLQLVFLLCQTKVPKVSSHFIMVQHMWSHEQVHEGI